MAYKYNVTLHLNKLLDEDVQQILQIIYYYNKITFTQNWCPGIIKGAGLAESL